MRYLKLALGLAVAMAGAQSAAQVGSELAEFANPFAGAEPAEYLAARDARDRLAELPDSIQMKSAYMALFESLESARGVMRSGSAPIFISIASFRDRERAWFADRNAYRADLQRYIDDGAAYVAAGGGGTYAKDDPKLAMLQAWYQRRVDWKGRLDPWVERVNNEARALNALERSHNQTLANEYAAWRSSCAQYASNVDRIVRRGKIEAELEAVRKRLANHRRELDRYKTTLPGLHADIEKMALEADEARQDGKLVALDEMTSMALDRLTLRVDARAKVAKGRLDQIEAILKKHGVKDTDVGLVLKNHAGRTVTREAELLDQLGKFKDVAAAYDATTKQQYLLALASLLQTFIKSPMLKLALTNIKVYASLIHTGTSYVLAKARVEQYDKLSEQELAAVAKISELYKKDLRKEKALKEQLAAMG